MILFESNTHISIMVMVPFFARDKPFPVTLSTGSSKVHDRGILPMLVIYGTIYLLSCPSLIHHQSHVYTPNQKELIYQPHPNSQRQPSPQRETLEIVTGSLSPSLLAEGAQIVHA
jgi:hypothetical protein